MPSKTNYFYFSGKEQDPCPVNFFKFYCAYTLRQYPHKKICLSFWSWQVEAESKHISLAANNTRRYASPY